MKPGGSRVRSETSLKPGAAEVWEATESEPAGEMSTHHFEEPPAPPSLVPALIPPFPAEGRGPATPALGSQTKPLLRCCPASR